MGWTLDQTVRGADSNALPGALPPALSALIMYSQVTADSQCLCADSTY